MQDRNIKDQASSLRAQIKKSTLQDPEQLPDVLPPRSVTHTKRKKRNKGFSYLFIRLLFGLFILLLLLMITYPYWGASLFGSLSLDGKETAQETTGQDIQGGAEVIVRENTIEETSNHQSQPNLHVVQETDTLLSIAEKYYHHQRYIDLIIQENQLENNTIVVGETLMIPKRESFDSNFQE
ncbi:peptidoglycan-binding LysM [Gracilibacillus halophilus YIM-C55.5]|uniref:Peptidoglycan-binding LysM n=1 Tax=Gracilibacillus halophilus YIM-C55.5 TaxID=1308866 RepID=N4WDM9_9BACI|nr:LysM peptidoglycan-binding domain-containing protein [Gracilibacillus halophilus]ENH97364.1 peptidoglycan-binding LysM [Gracilibacillus halophilus YIM-C55.5]